MFVSEPSMLRCSFCGGEVQERSEWGVRWFECNSCGSPKRMTIPQPGPYRNVRVPRVNAMVSLSDQPGASGVRRRCRFPRWMRGVPGAPSGSRRGSQATSPGTGVSRHIRACVESRGK